MAFIQTVLAYIFAPLVLVFGWIGPNGGINEDPAQYKQYENVILFIGDGMGENHLRAAVAADPDTPLVMETMAVRGQSRTNSWPGVSVTDSAAGASALACGIRNIDGQISVFPLDPLQWFATPVTLAELAIQKGKLAGVVTTDSTSGATPGAFSAHSSSRDNEEEVSLGQMASGLTLIWGAGSASINEAGAKAGGFDKFVTSKSEMLALNEGERSFGQFNGDDLKNIANPDATPTLTEMTETAIDLLDDDPDGFFLMVEAAHIDKFSHGQDIDNAIRHVRTLDSAVAYAMEYAAREGDTLVLVTADHETGSVTLVDGKYICTTGSHSGANVPVLVNVEDAGFKSQRAWMNRQIGVQLGRVMGFGRGEFPSSSFPTMPE